LASKTAELKVRKIKSVKRLKCQLTVDERLNEIENMNQIDVEISEIVSQIEAYKSELKALHDKRSLVEYKIKTGTEERSVECIQQIDYSKGTMFEFRSDTSEIILDERPIPVHLKQMEFTDNVVKEKEE